MTGVDPVFDGSDRDYPALWAAVVVERRAADALAAACDAAVRSGYIGSRSEIADALLSYRETVADTRGETNAHSERA